jgi:NAD(P)-dependent dehydrogenase (short-subunit alcohol dehydrogenase family)
VNNAGIAGRGAVEKMPLHAFRQIMETDYSGALRCNVLPGMLARRARPPPDNPLQNQLAL